MKTKMIGIRLLTTCKMWIHLIGPGLVRSTELIRKYKRYMIFQLMKRVPNASVDSCYRLRYYTRSIATTN